MSRIVEFARDELGLELAPAQAEMLASFTEGGKHSQATWQCGRRGGKSLLSDVLALYDATLRDDLRQHMRPREPRVAAIICPRQDQAEQHIRTCADLLSHSPRLSKLLVSQTSDCLTFANASEIRAYPCSARSIRGGAWSSCVLDEFGHFLTSDEGNAAGDRILEAALPALAQFGDSGWLVAISTPLWRQGAFWKLVERARSERFGHIHYRHHATAAMNPRISTSWLEERRREDPELYSREFEAQFVDGVSSYLASEDVVACVRGGLKTLPMRSCFKYVGALDPAYSHDAFAMAVGHAESGQVIVDGVWTWTRQGHERTLDAVADVAKEYRLTRLRTDQHSPVPIQEGLRKRGLGADYVPWTNETKASAFASLKIALNTRAVELPDDAALVEELCRLEATPTAAGYTRIAAASRGHDDRAVVVAAVVHQLARRPADPEALKRLSELNEDLREPDVIARATGQGRVWPAIPRSF